MPKPIIFLTPCFLLFFTTQIFSMESKRKYKIKQYTEITKRFSFLLKDDKFTLKNNINILTTNLSNESAYNLAKLYLLMEISYPKEKAVCKKLIIKNLFDEKIQTLNKDDKDDKEEFNRCIKLINKHSDKLEELRYIFSLGNETFKL